MKDKIDFFVDWLSNIETLDNRSLNMYQGSSVGAKLRRAQLSFYLKVMQEKKPTRLFVGEAPGRYGCLQSGIPFTDMNAAYSRKHIFFDGIKEYVEEYIDMNLDWILEEGLQRESTASIVWERLDQITMSRYPLMWNIYPFHPSTVQNLCPSDRRNRKPTQKECLQGIRVLEALLDCFDIKKIYAIGRTSERLLKPDFEDVQYIRHPSNGGITKFRESFNIIYKLNN